MPAIRHRPAFIPAATATVFLSALLSACGGGGGGGGGSSPEAGARDLYVRDISLAGRDGVPLNEPMEIDFSEFVLPGSIRHDTVQVRVGPRFGIQAPGEWKVSGGVVTFFPRLPVEADLSDGGFQPQTTYRVTVVGHPKVNRVQSFTGRPLVRTFTGDFSTAAATSPDLFTTDVYRDAPPPRVLYSNPPDRLPEAPWTAPGGAVDVPTDAEIVLVMNKVPLHPASVTPGNVTLRMIERMGVPQNRPVQGTPILEQTFDGVRLRFVPAFPLADQARYALRVENRVTDLTGTFDVADNSARTGLRSAAESGLDPALAAFALAHPEEVDPRTFLVFTTRDEPRKDLTAFLDFDGSDSDQDGGDGHDADRSTASFDDEVPGAVAAIFTPAGGTGRLGDFIPASNTVLDTNSPSAENGAFHYRRIVINPGITVTLKGTLPASLLATGDADIQGTLDASGGAGENAEASYNTSSLPLQRGGRGAAGAGDGGDSYIGTGYSAVYGGSGRPASGGVGGGGEGGRSATVNTVNLGGGGGGGGNQYPGSAGSNGTYPSGSQYKGRGGRGGDAVGSLPSSAATADGRTWHSSPVAGAGGGAGGNTYYYPSSNNWRSGAAGGGAGGGALLLKAGGDLVVGGSILVRGGAGGSLVPGYYYYGAAGGGGAGGTVSLWAGDGLDVSGAFLDASGGAGGLPYAPGYQGAGGKGGGGFARLEDGDGQIAGLTGGAAASILPDYSTGTFDPVGTASDEPTVFLSTWFNTGVFDPALQPFNQQDFTDQDFPGCTIRYEIQMAREDGTDYGRADVSAVDPVDGSSSDLSKASGWHVFKDPALGILDPTADLVGKGYQFFRVRITFTLKDGQRSGDPVPFVDRLRLRFQY